jgi:lysophospholipase L1-like esterase
MKALLLPIAAALLTACSYGDDGGTIQHPFVPALRSHNVAMVGDSITALWVPADMPEFQPLNLAVFGVTTDYMLATELPKVLDAKPEIGILVIDGGINDVKKDNATDAEILDNIRTMARIATEHGIRVIIGSLMYEAYDGVDASYYATTPDDRIDELDRQLLELCATEGYVYADYKDAMLLPDGQEDFSLYIDRLHPNDEGYARMWEVLGGALKDDGIGGKL